MTFSGMTHCISCVIHQQTSQFRKTLIDSISSLLLHNWFQNLKRDRQHNISTVNICKRDALIVSSAV